jgi:hypothetical protein
VESQATNALKFRVSAPNYKITHLAAVYKQIVKQGAIGEYLSNSVGKKIRSKLMSKF